MRSRIHDIIKLLRAILDKYLSRVYLYSRCFAGVFERFFIEKWET